ncbi:unnamed protein product [Hyaloperonospora brassicae]|uniref:AB hydrolase-1 domain-containing protein n=1 Tax=Hyaloperonospora brassicae TaxID=162125 RepID=A0AAV0U5Z8_HYABA|nr:unnamed protein product [Hyaloperonospora brassicae]
MRRVQTQLRPRYARLALALALLYCAQKTFGRSLLAALIRRYFLRSGETPKLVYRATPTNTTLLALCPALTKHKYYPPRLLFNGHLQTVRFAYDDRGPKIRYRRQLLKLPDDGVVSLDWALLPDRNDPSTTLTEERPPLLGCPRDATGTAQLFCSAYTDDLRFVLHQLREQFDFAREAFIGAGFSMGSNVLVKYLGEDGSRTPLTGAISIGNPFDLTICSANFGDSLLHRMTYDKALNNNLRELFFDKCNAAEQFRNHPDVDLEVLKATRTVRDFDDTLTKHVFHYDTVDDYYSDAGSVKKLGGVRVPLLCINAEDDPISVSRALPTVDAVEANPYVILCTTKSGGHLAFYESSLKSVYDRESNMWTAYPIAEFAEAVRLSRIAGQVERCPRDGAAAISDRRSRL